jgi:hypothetical protein
MGELWVSQELVDSSGREITRWIAFDLLARD